MVDIKSIDRRKWTIRLLYSLPFLAVLSLLFYSYGTVSRVLLLFEGLVFFLLLLLNYDVIGTRKRWILLLVNLASVAVTMLFHSGIGCAIAYFNMLSAFYVFNNIVISKNESNTLHILTAYLLVIYFLTSNIGVLYNFERFTDINGNEINSNVAGMLFLALVFHMVRFTSGLSIKKQYKLGLNILILVLGGYVVYLTRCRSALIALLAFVFFIVVLRRELSYKLYKFATVSIMLLSIAFTFVYILMYQNFSDLTILGKRLFTGREIVWTSAFEHIKNSFLIGNGTDVVLDTVGGGTTVSAHNMLLSLWYTLGLVPVGTTIFFFVNKLKDKEESAVDKISQLAFIASLFVCFFESFYTDPNIQIFFLPFLINNIKSNEEENADDPEEDSLLLVRGEAAEQAGEEMP